MKQENKEELLIAGILIILSPFIIAYEILKGAYNCLPHKILERKRINEEIKELEEKLGKSSDEKNKNMNFDEYYFGGHKNSSRKEYLEVLRQKIRENYKAPDIIIAAEHFNSQPISISFNDKLIFNVYLVVKSSILKDPECYENAKKYMSFAKKVVYSCFDNQWFFYTISGECPDYSKYSIVKTNIELKFKDIKDSEEVKKYIKEFREQNIKEQQ